MLDLNNDLIEKYDDQEISYIFDNADLDYFLEPMKKEPVRYKKYVRRLGNMDKKSQLVKAFLPKYAYSLYKDGDIKYKDALVKALEQRMDLFEQVITKKITPTVTFDQIKTFTEEEYAELVSKVSQETKDLPLEMILLILKAKDIIIDDSFVASIKAKIKQGQKFKEIELQYAHKIDEALKNQERTLKQKYESEIEDYSKDSKRLSNELKEANKTIRELQAQIKDIKDAESLERKQLYDKWERESKEKLNTEIGQMRQERLLNLEEDIKEKQNKADETLQEKIKDANEDIAKLNKEKDELLEIKQLLTNKIANLNQDKEKIDKELQNLRISETEYFANIRQRFLLHELDKNLFGIEDKKRTQQGEDHDIDAYVYKWKSFSDNTESSDEISCIADFFDDFRDNISLSFDDPSEIAALIISTFANGKAVILEDGVALYAVDSIAELVDGASPTVVEANNANAAEIISIIKRTDAKVIYLAGILDLYNEALFVNICRQCCNEKYLFFGINSVEDVKLFSKNIHNYGVILDIDGHLSFGWDEPILTGKYDFRDVLPIISIEDSKKVYDKHFKKLVSDGLISKRHAIDYSRLLGIYFESMDGIGSVLKKSFLIGIQGNLDEEEIDKDLKKCGWK
ncbi:hypothetical protein [Butyrivibrio sp. INlla16]|uniref:hypothetical protein n=1 Tax=Butyrivibrio sp. INlla16 TaxID=1520807 RepID=UPI00088FE5D7|nr:hypothetical protein [Butyrivibrio sp. INlla16]SDB53946.1 hypothetical protein SAMN02910263_02728 [Butyrivibrio sp. INlla16]